MRNIEIFMKQNFGKQFSVFFASWESHFDLNSWEIKIKKLATQSVLKLMKIIPGHWGKLKIFRVIPDL